MHKRFQRFFRKLDWIWIVIVSVCLFLVKIVIVFQLAPLIYGRWGGGVSKMHKTFPIFHSLLSVKLLTLEQWVAVRKVRNQVACQIIIIRSMVVFSTFLLAAIIFYRAILVKIPSNLNPLLTCQKTKRKNPPTDMQRYQTFSAFPERYIHAIIFAFM